MSDIQKGEMVPFKRIPRGSKLSISVTWEGGVEKWHAARKMNADSVELLTGREKGCRLLVEREATYKLEEFPHEDGDFSYLCNGEYCRCSN